MINVNGFVTTHWWAHIMETVILTPQPWIDAPGSAHVDPELGQTAPSHSTGVVTYLYAGGGGYGSAHPPVWESSEIQLTLEDATTKIRTPYRWGADVAVGASDGMFSLLLFSYQTGRPITIAYFQPTPASPKTFVIAAVATA